MQIPKKVCVVAVEGDAPTQLLASGEHGELLNLGQLVRTGTLAPTILVPDPTDLASNWVALATAAWQTNSATPETIWQTARRVGKNYVVVNFPFAPNTSADAIETSDWDLCWIRFVITHQQTYAELDQWLGRILQSEGKETLVVLVHLGMATASASAKQILAHDKSPVKQTRAIQGLAILHGPGIKKGFTLQRTVRINDFVPTICHLLELPMPEETDGAVLYQAFQDPNFQAKQLRTLRAGLARLEQALADEPWQPWHGTGEPAF
jgi:hypothetical protein